MSGAGRVGGGRCAAAEETELAPSRLGGRNPPSTEAGMGETELLAATTAAARERTASVA